MKTPFEGLTLAPKGNPGSRLNVRVLPLGSVAELVKERGRVSLMVRFAMAVSTGGLLLAPTILRMPDELVALWPSGLVIVTVRGPALAPAATERLSVRWVGSI